MPFAFADIEMIFEDDFRAIDWVFRYGNPAKDLYRFKAKFIPFYRQKISFCVVFIRRCIV